MSEKAMQVNFAYAFHSRLLISLFVIEGTSSVVNTRIPCYNSGGYYCWVYHQYERRCVL